MFERQSVVSLNMGTTIDCWIEYDEYGDPPFSVAPETLSLANWLDLRGAKDYRVYGAISGVRNETGIPLLYELRGIPNNPGYEVEKELQGDDWHVGWLHPDEVKNALEHHHATDATMSLEMRSVLHLLDWFASEIGSERVRFVFYIE